MSFQPSKYPSGFNFTLYTHRQPTACFPRERETRSHISLSFRTIISFCMASIHPEIERASDTYESTKEIKALMKIQMRIRDKIKQKMRNTSVFTLQRAIERSMSEISKLRSERTKMGSNY